MNSKSEFNRSYIPRLKVEEHDKIKEMEQHEEEAREALMETLKEEDELWERSKNVKKTGGTMVMGSSMKRGSKEDRNKGRRKKFKFDIINEDWGAPKTISEVNVGADTGSKGGPEDTGQSPVLPTKTGGAVEQILGGPEDTGQRPVLPTNTGGAPQVEGGASSVSNPHQDTGRTVEFTVGNDNAHSRGEV